VYALLLAGVRAALPPRRQAAQHRAVRRAGGEVRGAVSRAQQLGRKGEVRFAGGAKSGGPPPYAHRPFNAECTRWWGAPQDFFLEYYPFAVAEAACLAFGEHLRGSASEFTEAFHNKLYVDARRIFCGVETTPEAMGHKRELMALAPDTDKARHPFVVALHPSEPLEPTEPTAGYAGARLRGRTLGCHLTPALLTHSQSDARLTPLHVRFQGGAGEKDDKDKGGANDVDEWTEEELTEELKKIPGYIERKKARVKRETFDAMNTSPLVRHYITSISDSSVRLPSTLPSNSPHDHMILRVHLVGSHGRWKRPCLQTAHITI
jgi:hypothetical protein